MKGKKGNAGKNQKAKEGRKKRGQKNGLLNKDSQDTLRKREHRLGGNQNNKKAFENMVRTIKCHARMESNDNPGPGGTWRAKNTFQEHVRQGVGQLQAATGEW